MEYKTLLMEVADGVAKITLNRPKAGNALSWQMSHDLLQAVLFCDGNPDVRAVVFTGAGKIFFAGGDLRELNAQGNKARHFKEMTTYFHGAISRLARMNAPVIAAVNGTAGGAGMSFVCACDLAISAESAKFVMAYTNAGLSPDGSSTFYLPRIVGLHRAMELTLTNRVLSAQEAMDWGIVNRIVANDEVVEEAMVLAKKLAKGPSLAYGASKRLLYSSFNESLETQMEHEAQAIAALTMTADGQEGVAAFLEKRKPDFKGK